ncbi:hypothetical protein FA13DRAFT_1812712 [Coprinellus micaceus]|uniref:Nephrocystin 3-like N-terminal domain-containing protein n=1 Tax=Coprinellus micaceus TaxID=71717 RepID=A0A4Y7TJ99_COPMI|nr:hypothetical protein FA13DRAFT_1812712 [Coprinellus micaceus]
MPPTFKVASSNTQSSRGIGHTKGTDLSGDKINHHSLDILVKRDVHVSVPGEKELYTHVAVGCIHNSAERIDAPRCHPETRRAVQEDIYGWISDGRSDGAPDPGQQFLWLTGPAGGGKSAIMGTVCDELAKRGQLAAAFFFSAYSHSLERSSKKRFVTTLASQLRQHPDFKNRISRKMLATIHQNPTLFEAGLREQMEALILQPLRDSDSGKPPTSTQARAIVIDGVDECGEDRYEPGRSKQEDQIEVLSILFEAISDPAFPFRIIVASRPEVWIRRFFTSVPGIMVTNIFLDNKYNPDDDIRVFLKSKFAMLCRRYGLNPSTWPGEEVIAKLVEDSSGQFVYAATILRFIDAPGTRPQAQLEAVLRTGTQDSSNPFSALDALYTSILRLSPEPDKTVLWLKAYQALRCSVIRHQPSAWTTNCLLESVAGQAQILLSLPSLIYLARGLDCDSLHYGQSHRIPSSIIPKIGWDTSYSFYHTSFVDFLGDPRRCGAAFPDVSDARVEQWIWERMFRVLIAGGPEVPVDPALLSTFKICFYNVWVGCMKHSRGHVVVDEDVISHCDPTAWLDIWSVQADPRSIALWRKFRHDMFILVHKNCRSYRPCHPGCKRWRHEVSRLGKDLRVNHGWTPFTLLLDRFCVKRLSLLSV